MSAKIEGMEAVLRQALGDALLDLNIALGEVTVVIDSAKYHSAMEVLRDSKTLRFDQLIDICGVDYSGYGEGTWRGRRFAVVAHLLSIIHNWRIRVRVFALDDVKPVISSVTDIWPAANWFEREAFDMFGIEFDGHPDPRRILTDYDFVGYPFRKDFPVSGYVEMRYDEVEKRVLYQPVTIEPRELTPRVIREPHYGAE